jgi:hypothetical protein
MKWGRMAWPVTLVVKEEERAMGQEVYRELFWDGGGIVQIVLV